MADIVDAAARSRMMSGIQGKNTSPERRLRSILHRRGLRFRLHARELPGRPDLVFPRYKVAIFVNGCFWHGHANCRYFKVPSTNVAFWRQKIEGNQQRDRRDCEKLGSAGWRTLVVWECAIRPKQRADVLAESVERWIRRSRQQHASIGIQDVAQD